MGYELREHTADVAVAATGPDLGATVAAVADGMTAAMAETVPAGGERADVMVCAESREALLFDYLDRLIYERDVEGVLPVENDATVESGGEGDPEEAWTVAASYRAVPLSAVSARDLKAVTYSEMELSPTAEGWRAYVVFDV